MSVSFNVSGASNLNPYVFGAGWTELSSHFKVESGALLPVTDAAPSVAVVSSPVSSGLMEIIWTTNHGNGLYTDNDGVVFSSSSGNGYIIFFNGDRLYLYEMVSFSETNYLKHTSLTYVDGDQFRVIYDLNTNTISAYQISVSNTVPIWSQSGCTPSVGMANGILTRKNNSGTAGIRAATLSSGVAYSIDTISSPLLLGSTGNIITTTGLGTLTSLTVGGKVVSNLSAPSGDGTFSIPAWTDGVQGFLIGLSQPVVAGDGTNTANGTVTINQQNGYSVVTLTSINSSFAYLGGQISLSVGDQIIFPTAANLGTTINYIDVDGGIYTDFDGSQTLYKRANSNGIITAITLINGEVENTPSFDKLRFIKGSYITGVVLN